MTRILVVDDKELMRDSISTTLARLGWTVHTAPEGKAALRIISERKPEVVLTDLQMPGMDGLSLLREIRKLDEQLPVVFMTAFATVQTAVDAMKHGAFDYLTKPFEGDQLVATLKRAAEHAGLLRENAVLRSQLRSRTDGRSPELIGKSAELAALRETIDRIAPSHGTVLITGESGVGKEVVAQIIHAHSPRKDAPLLAVNCAALSASLLESELFGHEKGAFTGADKLRKGRFELADGGAILLDEISEIPPAIQAKLLRVLQERAFERVGSSATQHTDVRVIATSNRDLRQCVAAGTFRQDLYYRLHVLPVPVPPLRDRMSDLPLLAEHFLGLVSRREGRPARRFDPEALFVMAQYDWPGNVRELYNICERASILSREELIPASLITPWLSGAVAAEATLLGARPAAPALNGPIPPAESEFTLGPGSEAARLDADFIDGPTVSIPRSRESIPVVSFTESSAPTNVSADTVATLTVPGRTLEEIEREVIVAALTRHKGHRQRTAKELHIGIRTLGLKIRRWKELQLVAPDL